MKQPAKAVRKTKSGKPSKKRMMGGKKRKVDGPLEKKKKGVSLNPVDRSKLRKLMLKKQSQQLEKENDSTEKPQKFEKPTSNSPDIDQRKRRLSGSSVDSAGSIKRSKKKRVSFANELEHTKMLDTFDDSITLEMSTSTPGRSILRRKQQQAAAEEQKRKLKKEKKQLEDEQGVEKVDKVKETTGEESEQKERAAASADTTDDPPMKIKSKPKLQVTKKMKEKLLAMPRKERKAFIRQLKAKRKPNFEIGAQCKILWEKIRSGKTPKDEKDKVVHELCGIVKGKAKTLIYAHDTCRVIECLMTLDRPGIRAMLFEELKPEIVRMSKSKYARFFVWKMLKYGTPQQRSTICEAFRGHVTSLLRQTFGSEVLEFAYNDYANAQQRSDIVAELYGREYTFFRPGKPITLQEIIANDPLKKPAIMRNMEELLKDIVDKPALKHSLTHRLLNEFLENCDAEQRTEMIDAIKERVVEMIHTRDGAHAALHCLWYGTAKERKIIVKSFKGLAVKTCHEEYGRLVLMAIFDCVDDTVLVKKCIVQDIANDIKQVVTNKYGVKVVHYLCHPRDKRHFLKETVQLLAKGDDNPHSKKEKKDRYSELWECVSSALLTFIAANMRDLIFETSTSLLVLNALEASGEGNLFDRTIPDADRLECYKAIAEIARDEFIPCNMEERFHLVEHKNASFVVAHLLKSDKTRTDTEVTLSAQLAELDTEQLASWTACNKGCFVLLDMYDSGNAKAVAAVRSAVTSSHKRLEGYSSQGAKLLLAKVAT